MSDGEARLAQLRRQAALDREELAQRVGDMREDIQAFRKRWRFAGWAASGAAAAAAAGWKLFGRNSLAAQASRLASGASLLLGIGRGIRTLRRFW